ncbi:MAG TPA: hypothetical protein VGE39_26860, partial [Prosthecobacter sp.]
VWGLHETETSSKTIQQRRIMEFFPPEMNPTSGKMRKDRKTRLTYTDGGGFTGNMFNLVWTCHDELGRPYTGGGLFDFKFYKSDISTLQGAELTCGVSDELVPRATCDTVRERLLSRAADTRRPEFLARIREAIALMEAGKDVPGPLLALIYHGVHLIGFTPKEGYSSTVADFLDGATTIEEVDTRAVRPDMRGLDEAFVKEHANHELLPGKKVPRFKQPKKPTRLVAYLHTYDNAHKGNWPAMVQQCKGAPDEYIRVIAYGDVSKGWSMRFPKWRDTLHVIDKAEVPREGTWYHIVDPGEEKNWFMIWALCDRWNRLHIVREWPQEGDNIPDVGDPGPWAITSEKGYRNGDKGPAQNGWGFGYERMKREIERIEKEIALWWRPESERSQAIDVTERYMDSRFGWAARLSAGGSTTIMSEMENLGLFFLPASGDRLAEGDNALNDALDFDAGSERGSGRELPKLRVMRGCTNTIFMFQNYGDPLKPGDDKCKDPRDVAAYLVLSEPVFQGEGSMRILDSGGGY